MAKILVKDGRFRLLNGKLLMGAEGDPCCCDGPVIDCTCPDLPAPPQYGLVRISGLNGTFTVYDSWVEDATYVADVGSEVLRWRTRNFWTFQVFQSSSCSCPQCYPAELGVGLWPGYGGSLPTLIRQGQEVEHQTSNGVSPGTIFGTRPAEGVTFDDNWFAVYLHWSLTCVALELYVPTNADSEGWPEGTPGGFVAFRATVDGTTSGSVSNEVSTNLPFGEYPFHSSLTIARNVETCRLCARYPVEVVDGENRYVQESMDSYCAVASNQWVASVYADGQFDEEFGGANYVAFGTGTPPTTADMRAVTFTPSREYVNIASFSASPCCGATGTYTVPLYYESEGPAQLLLDASDTGTPPEGFPETISVTGGACDYDCAGGKRDFLTCASSYLVTISGCTGAAAVLNGARVFPRVSNVSYTLVAGVGSVSGTITSFTFLPTYPDYMVVSAGDGAGVSVEFRSGPRDCDLCPHEYSWTRADGTSGTSGATLTLS